jgi:hypothetical protein
MYTVPSNEINVVTTLLGLVIVSHLGPKDGDASLVRARRLAMNIVMRVNNIISFGILDLN